MVYNGEKKHGGEWLVVVGREEDAEDERGHRKKKVNVGINEERRRRRKGSRGRL